MKHELDRLGSAGFEHLIQALMSKLFGVRVKIYGDGPDRQREAVVEDVHCSICGKITCLGRTIVQAKYKSADGKQDDWQWLRTNLKKELDGFAKKAESESAFLPQTWLFFTNVVLTPAKGGVKDKSDEFVAEYSHIIPRIYVLGTDEVRSLLDANPDVARSYAAFLTPGDVLTEAIDYLSKLKLEHLRGLMEYVRQRFRADEPVRLEQAGNVAEGSIAIQNVYIDMEAEEERAGDERIDGLAASILLLGDRPHRRSRGDGDTLRQTVSENNIVLLGNAGQGKSTLCQFICQIYRVSLLKRFSPDVEIPHAYSRQSGVEIPKCERFPFLIRLKEYAAWIKRTQEREGNCSILHYLVFLLAKEANLDLSIASMRDLLKSYSWIFVFDGLDEVPASSNRAELLRQIDRFLSQDLVEAQCDSIVMCTSRPQGYDAAFSQKRYRHLRLREMSPECCIRYIDRLLSYLEQSPDYRKKYRSILIKSLDDPLVAKLMTTPLYTAILVLLVKSGSTPPTRRYELFSRYCEIVLQRELQKELLPSLYDGDYAWVKEVHGLIAYLLQSESETAENAAAELPTPRCHGLIGAYLKEELWQGCKEEMTDKLYRAITERLPFLSETTDAESNNCVLFPLRSLQEYFAAEHLLRIEGPEQQRDMLGALSLSAYWRNVFLFVAGRYSKEDRRSINDSIYAICKENNGDPCFGGGNRDACRIALPGSRLALDLLCDNLFERRGGQDRYFELTVKLLQWDYSADSCPAFAKLPAALYERLVRDEAIPRVQKTKSPNDAAFELLYEETRKGNAEARDVLEQLVDTLLSPTYETLAACLNRLDSESFGVKFLHRLYELVFEDSHRELCCLDEEKLRLLEKCCIAEKWEALPESARRWALYGLLSGEIDLRVYRVDVSRLSILFNRDELLTVAESLRKRATVSSAGHRVGWDEILCEAALGPHSTAEEAGMWRRLGELSKRSGFDELGALAAFFCDPIAKNLTMLMAAYLKLPEHRRKQFSAVLRNWDMLFRMLLHDFTEYVERGGTQDEFLARCDTAYYDDARERKRSIVAALKEDDHDRLNELDAWIYLSYKECYYYVTRGTYSVAPWVPAVIGEASEQSCQCLMSTAFPPFQPTGLTDNMRQALLRRFSVALRFWDSGLHALYAFAQEPPESLVKCDINYPDYLPQDILPMLDPSISSAILERVRLLCALGVDFLNAYSLLPFIFYTVDQNTLSDMAEDASRHYDEVRATKNDCALLGVILLLLASGKQTHGRVELSADLDYLMRKMNPDVWYRYSVRFSLKGKLLVHEAGMNAYTATENEYYFRTMSSFSILQSLEALPADRDKLPRPGDLSVY